MTRQTTNLALAASDGLQLNLVDFGGSSTPPLLFLHGSFGHARVWDFVINELEPDQRAFALDLPGHGLSAHAEGPERYRFDALTRDVRVVIKTLSIPPVLVGHSLGSGLAMVYASRCPETLAGAVFMDIDPQPPEHQVQHLHDVGSRPAKRYEDFARAVARESRVAPNASPAIHEHLARHGYVRDGTTWDQRFDQRFLLAVERWDARQGLLNISVPSLVVRGAESSTMLPETVAFMLGRLPRGHAATIPGAGHQLHLDQPATVAQTLTAFIRDVVQPALLRST